MRPIRLLFPSAALLLLASLVTGCASISPEAEALKRAQYAWSGAIRWGDFAGARGLVDPETIEQQPLTELELRRFEQIKISYYRDQGASRNLEAGTATRNVEIGVINRHDMTERVVDYRETWRYDPQAETWWVTSGLPDLWSGE